MLKWRSIRRGLLTLAVASPLAAQTAADTWLGAPLRPCAQAGFEHPCRAAFDTPPTLVSPVDTTFAPGRTPLVWVLVDSTGRVLQSFIHRSVRHEADTKAVGDAKLLRFKPARLKGAPTAAWVVLPINVGLVLESCAIMAVPLSVWKAQFADSTLLDRPELGMRYRFTGVADFGFGDAQLDVFIYPAAGWPETARQAGDYVGTLAELQAEGRIASYEVLRRQSVSLGPERGSSVPRVLRGDEAQARLHLPDGRRIESLFVVVRDEDRFIKVRATYPATGGHRRDAQRFGRDLLRSIRSRPMHCRT